MTNCTDFEREDGTIDWDAYHDSQVQAGNRCMSCGTLILNLGLFSKPIDHAQDCISCRSMNNDSGEVTHDEYIRCPKCKHQHDASDEWEARIYEDGEHDIICVKCYREFEVSTRVSYSYTSPKLL